MKKTAIVFVVSVFLFCLVEEVFAGGIDIRFEPGDEKTESFAEEFIFEMKKRENIIIYEFAGNYIVNIYVGNFPYPETGEKKSVIGIFIDGENKSVFRVWHEDLFSGRAMKRKVDEAVERVFEKIRKLDIKKRKKIMEIPI